MDETKIFFAINLFRTFVMNEHTVAMFDKVQPEKDLYRKKKKQNVGRKLATKQTQLNLVGDIRLKLFTL